MPTLDNLTARVEWMEIKLHNLTTEAQALQDMLSVNDNVFFLVTMAMVVFFMQSGFAFLEAGSVRSKNVTNILMKNVLVTFITAALYWACGYAFAFGEPSNPFIGYNYFFGANLPMEQYHKWLFQYTFAATASTIVSGAVAERCEFVAFIVYSCVINAWIYPVLSHWVWAPNGWLQTVGGENGGFHDFAGGGVVHLCGGTIALIANLFLGPRHGRFPKPNEPNVDLKGHSMPLTVIGAFIIAFGFLGFNGGSQGSISNDGDGATVALAAINTILAGTWGTLVAVTITRIREKRWSLMATCNGCLVGMVSSCPGCNVMYPWAGSLTGGVAGMLFSFTSVLLPKLKIDDPLDAVPVHFTGGFLGLIAAPIFNFNKGIVFFWDKKAFLGLAYNLAGACAIMAWCCACAIPLFWILKKLNCLRVSHEMEIRGLDIIKHKEPAYPIISYGHGWKELFTAEEMRFLLFPSILQGIDTKDVADNSYDEGKMFENQEMEVHEKLEKSMLSNLKRRILTGKKPNKIHLPPLTKEPSTSDKSKIVDNVVEETQLSKTETNAANIP